MLKIVKNWLNILPSDLFFHHTSILNIKNNFFYGNSSVYFGVLYGWLINQRQIAKIIFDFIDERTEINSFISKCI